jgi:hypothetical protein
MSFDSCKICFLLLLFACTRDKVYELENRWKGKNFYRQTNIDGVENIAMPNQREAKQLLKARLEIMFAQKDLFMVH